MTGNRHKRTRKMSDYYWDEVPPGGYCDDDESSRADERSVADIILDEVIEETIMRRNERKLRGSSPAV